MVVNVNPNNKEIEKDPRKGFWYMKKKRMGKERKRGNCSGQRKVEAKGTIKNGKDRIGVASGGT